MQVLSPVTDMSGSSHQEVLQCQAAFLALLCSFIFVSRQVNVSGGMQLLFGEPTELAVAADELHSAHRGRGLSS